MPGSEPVAARQLSGMTTPSFVVGCGHDVPEAANRVVGRAWGIACVLLIALWVRSYSYKEQFCSSQFSNKHMTIVESASGRVILVYLESYLWGSYWDHTGALRGVFITHGHGLEWRVVADFIEKECNPKLPFIELASRANKGRTVIEKLDEEAANCSFAVVVMTGDDLVADDETRARENVVHEIGFFQGRYGRGRVCLLHEEGVNIPSNLSGVAYCSFPKAKPWRHSLNYKGI